MMRTGRWSVVRIGGLLDPITGIADSPADDDARRLRRRVLVIAGYILILSSLQLPIIHAVASGHGRDIGAARALPDQLPR
jgi:hypothetical protein